MIKQLKLILISFSHLFLTSAYMISNLSKLDSRPKVFLQPPNYIFSFVWTTIYILFGIINLKILYNHNLFDSIKNNIINQSIYESLLHWLWLFINSKYFIQNIYTKTISKIIISYLLYFSYIRLYSIKKIDPFLCKLYLPYIYWISFALFLDLQNN